MSIPINDLREMYTEVKYKNKKLKQEVERLGNELRLARNDNELTRSAGEGMQSSECDEEYKRELQSKLDTANASIEQIQHARKELDQELRDERRHNAELQALLKQAQDDKAGLEALLEQTQDAKADLEDLLRQMQDALDHAERHRALGDDGDVQELQERLEEVQLELDHAEDYSMRRQSDLVAANETNRELRVTIEELQSKLDAACDANKELSDPKDELQMALDNADQSEASGDGEYVQELEYSLREKQPDLETANISNTELQEENNLVQDQLDYVAEGNWEHVLAFLHENPSTRIRAFIAGLCASHTELSKANADLLKSEANSAELREENQALRRDLETKSAEIDALRKETSKPAAKGELSPGEREQLRLKDRHSLHIRSGW